MIKNFVNFEIKRFDDEDFSVDCHPVNNSNHYYLRFRFFYPDGSGSEYEFWYDTLCSCILKCIQLLTSYSLGL